MATINELNYEKIVDEIKTAIRECEEDNEDELDNLDHHRGYIEGLNAALLLIETYKDWHEDPCPIAEHINERFGKNFKQLTAWQWHNESTGVVKLIFDNGAGEFIIDMWSEKNYSILAYMNVIVYG
ncbi:MAG: hypothetical protein FWE36_07940 [Erysipelotrichales bacterium]|nr:hypothetical protein [Erysipelotrichales bacterium]